MVEDGVVVVVEVDEFNILYKNKSIFYINVCNIYTAINNM